MFVRPQVWSFDRLPGLLFCLPSGGGRHTRASPFKPWRKLALLRPLKARLDDGTLTAPQVADVDACLTFGMPFTLTPEEDAATNLSQLEENRHLLTALAQVGCLGLLVS